MTEKTDQNGSGRIVADLSYERAKNHFKGMCGVFLEDDYDVSAIAFALLSVSLDMARAAGEDTCLKFFEDSRDMTADRAERLATEFPYVAWRYQVAQDEEHDTGARH